MIFEQVIARRYAKALLLSLPKDQFSVVEEELSALAKLITNSPEFKRLFSDPAFSPLERRAVLSKIAEKYRMNESLRKFLELLVYKNRFSLLSLIYQALVTQIDSVKGRLRVKIISASMVDAGQLNEICEALKKASKLSVLAEPVIDDSLLAGIRIEVAGKVFDGSLKAKLTSIKDNLKLLAA